MHRVGIVCDSTAFIHTPSLQSAAQSSRNASCRSPSKIAPGTSALLFASNSTLRGHPFHTSASGTSTLGGDLNLRSSMIAKLTPP